MIIRSSNWMTVILLYAIGLLSCSNVGCGSGRGNPAIPSNITSESPSLSQSSPGVHTNHQLWGLWEINISPDRESVEIIPVRSVEMHLNVVRLLEVIPCLTCLTIENIHPAGPNKIEADVKLQHPFPPGLLKYTGFDVRGIFIAQSDFTFPASGRKIAWGDSVPRMLNPDGYTPLFNPTEYPETTPAALGYIPGQKATGGDLSATLNPFVAYRKDAPRRMFEAGGAETQTVQIYAPAGPVHFGYAVDACWQLVQNVVDPLVDFPPDANCLEAYAISVDIGTGLQPFAGSSVPIEVEVYDHQGQDTISSVTVEAPDLFNGEMGLAFSTTMPDGSFLFTGTLSNDLGAGEGEYPVLTRVTDWESDQNLGKIDAWQVSTVEVSTQYVGNGWARTWGGNTDDSDSPYADETGCGVAVDGSGNVYVTGCFKGTSVDFNPDPTAVDLHSSNGDYGIFLSKFDTSGTFVWARTWGGSVVGYFSLQSGSDVALDGSGSVYVTGDFQGTSVDFNPDPIEVDLHSSNGAADIFLSKFDSSGTFVWAHTWGGSSDDWGEGVDVDGSGNVYVTGSFYGTFLSKFDSSGTFVWTSTSSGGISGMDVAVDGSGNAYVTGSIWEAWMPLPEAFLGKFDSSGTFMWGRTWGGHGPDAGLGVAVDVSGYVYVTGYFSDLADFNPDPTEVDLHSSNGDEDAFLSKFDSSGTFVWARTWGGGGREECYGVAVDESGYVYVTGWFMGTVDFNPDPIAEDIHSGNDYGGDIFLSKFDSSGTFVWARTWGLSDYPGGGFGYGVDVDGFGHAYVTGAFRGTSVDFNPDPIAVDPHSANGDWDVFLSKFKPDGYW